MSDMFSENPMLLVMEFVARGSLSHYLHQSKQTREEIPQDNLLTFGEEIAQVSLHVLMLPHRIGLKLFIVSFVRLIMVAG